MPTLQVNLADAADVRAAIAVLTAIQGATAVSPQPAVTAAPQTTYGQAVAEIKQMKIWNFLRRVAKLDATEFSLPELAALLRVSTNRVGSKIAILGKPEQRLGIQFFEPVPAGAVDAAGNPRYRMPDAIRQEILANCRLTE